MAFERIINMELKNYHVLHSQLERLIPPSDAVRKQENLF